MAEGHNAVAFSFSVSPEGVNVNFNHELWRAVWASGVRSWRKRIGMMKNSYFNGIFPVSPASVVLAVAPTTAVYAVQQKDVPLQFLERIHTGLSDSVQHAIERVPLSLVDKVKHLPVLRNMAEPSRGYLCCVLTAAGTWLAVVIGIRCLLRALLSYQGWMFEVRRKISFKTKLWLVVMKVLTGRRPLLYSYQGALPRLPVPSLHDTMERYLRSVRPLKSDEDYKRLELLVRDFEKGLGPKLQRYLVLKSWWASNYVSDWWEEYVYLRGRAPIMINSNFYGLDAVFKHPTKIQAARGGNVIYAMLQFRRLEQREELKPIMLPSKVVPLCSAQYVRQFNTTRVPGVETDTLVHYNDSQWVVVYHRGRYFKMYVYHKGKLLLPCQIETMLQQILDDPSPPLPGEEHLAALTAADRIPWAKARQEYFKKGINKASLDAIEKAAFVVALDDEPQDFDPNDPSKFDHFGRAMLHGKGYDRWFDKSFNLIICSNGRIGMNAEHSWADAPIMAHLWEIVTGEDYGYKEDGHCRGDAPFPPPNPIRLRWDISRQCEEVIEKSLATARQLIDDVDLHVMLFDTYGKGFIKKCNISPDAFIQMALQVAYFRDAGKFCLTYESSMTRLFREGRTETVRSCTIESCDFVRALDNPAKTNKEKVDLLHQAAEQHQEGYRNAMTGRGIDRHLFCLYVVSRYLNKDSPFLREVLSEPWRLSTSQTPHQQTDKIDLSKHPDLICAGGGFGPVADDGYGVSYIIAGEDVIFFHISRKKSCSLTDAKRFGRNISQAMLDMRKMFSELSTK